VIPRRNFIFVTTFRWTKIFKKMDLRPHNGRYLSGISQDSDDSSPSSSSSSGPDKTVPTIICFSLVGIFYLFLFKHIIVKGLRRRRDQMEREELYHAIVERRMDGLKKVTCDERLNVLKNNLSHQKFSEYQSSLNERPSTCCVCLTEYDANDIIVMSSKSVCNHVFHEKCLLHWLNTHDDCPMCRRRLLPNIKCVFISSESEGPDRGQYFVLSNRFDGKLRNNKCG